AKVVAMGAALPTPTPGQQTFQDVATNSTFWQWIEELSTAGAISGYECGGAGEPCDVGNKPYFRPYDYLAMRRGFVRSPSLISPRVTQIIASTTAPTSLDSSPAILNGIYLHQYLTLQGVQKHG
ncbi:MAG TPA: hypothetical protein VLQ48_16605, partial [Chloroflexia bacterium]|nr:hypothetical protein [Chloroflexia bacterium]